MMSYYILCDGHGDESQVDDLTGKVYLRGRAVTFLLTSDTIDIIYMLLFIQINAQII